MRLLFDTNIILDQLISIRNGHLKAVALEKRMTELQAKPMCALHSLSIIEYIAQKSFSRYALIQILEGLVNNYLIPKIGSEETLLAFQFIDSDFEDALQVLTAVVGNADLIISNDRKGFTKSPIEVVTPGEFLKRYSK